HPGMATGFFHLRAGTNGPEQPQRLTPAWFYWARYTRKTQKPKNPKTQKPKNPKTQKPKNPKTQKPNNPKIFRPKAAKNCSGCCVFPSPFVPARSLSKPIASFG